MFQSQILTGAAIFDGHRRHERAALWIEAGRVRSIIPDDTVKGRGCPVVRLDGGLLTPGLIDWQVNGGGGKQFNTDPTVDTIATIAKTHARWGTTAFLATVITDTPRIADMALSAVRNAMALGMPHCVGVHLEGPHLSRRRHGAHDPGLIRAISEYDLDRLSQTGIDTVVCTLAAETVAPEVINRMAAMGLTVSIGHSDADYSTAMAAFRAGARGVTHLFNAMGPLGHRAPGLVGAALDCEDVWCGVIADGIHVHPAVLGIALRAKRGRGRVTLVSDAMAPTGAGGDRFHLNGRWVYRHGRRLSLEDGTLAGCDLTMIEAVAFMVREVGLDLDEALRMASLYPAQFLGLDGERGALLPGMVADVLHLGDGIDVKAVWCQGAPVDPNGCQSVSPQFP